jgi:methionyl aminopeptidase
MISVKTADEIQVLKEGGKKLAFVLNQLGTMVAPGVSTIEIEMQGRELIKKAGGKPAFLGYTPRGAKSAYPAAICISVNEEVVHGLPSKRVLRQGDIVSLDAGLEYRGFFTDAAITLPVGNIDKKTADLVDATRKSLDIGISVLKDGSTAGDFGNAVQSFVEGRGFSVVRILVGHGVGYAPHEDPDIPNWGKKGHGIEFKEGMVLALEPMACEGRPEVVLSEDNWTWKTKDGLKSAHFEHTIAIEKNKASILTKE